MRDAAEHSISDKARIASVLNSFTLRSTVLPCLILVYILILLLFPGTVAVWDLKTENRILKSTTPNGLTECKSLYILSYYMYMP